VDGHQHVQQFAGIREPLVQALISRYGARPSQLPYLRISRAPAGAADLKSRVIAVMGANALEMIAGKVGITRAGALLGAYDFAGDTAGYARRMDGWLAVAPAGSVLMCHPARELVPDDAIGAARVREFDYLSSADFPTALAYNGVRLVRGASLAR